MVENWQDFLFPYQQAVNELKVKLRGMRKQFEEQAQHSPIERDRAVKPVDSIKEKMVRRRPGRPFRTRHARHCRAPDYVSICRRYLCGCRLLRQRSDMTILEERDCYQRQTQWLPVLPHCD